MPYVGEIRLFAGNFAPVGWALCQGQMLAISENDTLFNLIGTTYGGDGQDTFALPNLQSRVPIHMGTGPDGTTYQIGEMAGTETETLTAQQIPVHNHAVLANTVGGSLNVPAGAILGRVSSTQTGVRFYRPSASLVPLNAASIASTGGNQPHDNMQPFLVINFIISLFGVYPSQT